MHHNLLKCIHVTPTALSLLKKCALYIMTGTNTGITLQLTMCHLNQNILYVKQEQVNRHQVGDRPYS